MNGCGEVADISTGFSGALKKRFFKVNHENHHNMEVLLGVVGSRGTRKFFTREQGNNSDFQPGTRELLRNRGKIRDFLL